MIPIGHYREAEAFIKDKAKGFTPEVLLILGSGLGFLGDLCDDAVAIPYGDIPHMKASTAPGHKGQLVLGKLSGVNVAVMQGRVHYYEGYEIDELVFLPRVVRLLGADKLVVTNACGGIREGFAMGDMMLITDHIKFVDANPLRGANLPEFGVRFPDMSYTYTPEYWPMADECAAELGVKLQRGVYMMFPGPCYETPAEIRAARALGADAVGMSTVPEAIAARHAGMKILGISLISNLAAGLQKHELSEQEVIDAAEGAKEKFSGLILKMLPKMAANAN